MKISYKILTVTNPRMYKTHFWIEKTTHRKFLPNSTEVTGDYKTDENIGWMPFLNLIEAQVRIKHLKKDDYKIKTKTRGVGAFVQRVANCLSRKRNR